MKRKYNNISEEEYNDIMSGKYDSGLNENYNIDDYYRQYEEKKLKSDIINNGELYHDINFPYDENDHAEIDRNLPHDLNG